MYIQRVWFKILLGLIVVTVLFLCYKCFFPLREPEGFSQQEKYVVKYNQDIYDDFYVSQYDDIQQSKRRLRIELLTIVETTGADEKHSVFLDVGSGTGYAVKELNDLGYEAFGVDQSQAMVSFSEQKYPESNYKCGDVREPMLFEKQSFTHVICLYYTLYSFPDKEIFFRNSYQWLQPGGYLIVHLVEPDQFDMSVPSARHELFGCPQGINRNKESFVDFSQYQYKSSWKKTGSPETMLTETFTQSNGNIRQNEQTLYMDPIRDIVSMAVRNGFTVKSMANLKTSMHDVHQYLYFFERLL